LIVKIEISFDRESYGKHQNDREERQHGIRRGCTPGRQWKTPWVWRNNAGEISIYLLALEIRMVQFDFQKGGNGKNSIICANFRKNWTEGICHIYGVAVDFTFTIYENIHVYKRT
jgi:hypothetical protein